MFISCTPLKVGGSKIYQPIVALANLLLCDTTTYINSLGAEVKVDLEGDPLAPVTGPTKLNGDMVTFTDPLGILDYSTFSWEYETDTDAITTNDFADRFCDHYNSGVGGADTSSMLIQIRAPVVNNNYLQLQFKDASGALFYNKIASVNVSGRKTIKVTFDQPTSTMKTFVDGVEVVAITQVVTITGGFNLDSYIYGARSIGANYITMDFYSARITIPSLPARMGSVNFDVRLWGATDPDGNIFRDTNNNPYALTDSSPLGAVYPHEDAQGNTMVWPTSYLQDDRYQIGSSCVTVPAGFELATDSNGDYYIDPMTGQYGVAKI